MKTIILTILASLLFGASSAMAQKCQGNEKVVTYDFERTESFYAKLGNKEVMVMARISKTIVAGNLETGVGEDLCLENPDPSLPKVHIAKSYTGPFRLVVSKVIPLNGKNEKLRIKEVLYFEDNYDGLPPTPNVEIETDQNGNFWDMIALGSVKETPADFIRLADQQLYVENSLYAIIRVEFRPKVGTISMKVLYRVAPPRDKKELVAKLLK